MVAQGVDVSTEFRIGRVISTSLSIWLRNIIIFCLLGLLANLPGLLLKLFFTNGTTEGGASTSSIGSALSGAGSSISDLVFGQILIAIVTFGVFQQLRNRPLDIGACISAGLSRLLPVIGTSLIAGILIGLASLLLVIPGIILSMVFWVAIPVCVAENLGASASLSRSAGLTKGYRWQVFGIVLLLTVISIAIGAIVGLASGLGLGLMNASSTSMILVVYIVSSLLSAFQAVCSTTGYYYLRVAKEGVDIDQIAAVFD